MWVIKCGGSLARSGSLTPCLQVAVEKGAGRVVIVPGGGPFADCVRDQQGRLGYGDTAAHQMALLAMDQYAWYLSEREPRLQICDGITAAGRILDAGGVALLAASMELSRAPLPASWRVTADTLAAYVARQMGATDLLLLKSLDLRQRSIRVNTLVADKLLDAEFPAFIADAPYRVWWSGPNPHSLASLLCKSDSAAARIHSMTSEGIGEHQGGTSRDN